MSAMLLLTLTLAQSDEPPDPSTPTVDRVAAFVELARDAAAEYEMRTGDDPDEPLLELRAEPVLKWSNPVRGELYGGVFVWTRNGRPEVAAAIFKWYSPFTHMTHEFQSLSERSIRGGRPGKGPWQAGPGVTFAPVPNAPAPAKTAAGRLVQMRALARGFDAFVKPEERETVRLRLMTQPLLRYTVPGETETDGGLFTFVEGTDPEVLLLLEARPSSSGPRWEFACGRLNFVPLHVEHGKRTVWTAEALERSHINGHRNPYTKYILGKVRRITKEDS